MSQKKKWTKKDTVDSGLSLLAWAAGAGATYYFLRKKEASSTPTTKLYAGTSGLGAITKGFFPTIPVPTILGSIRRLVGDLGAAIGRAASRTNVPGWLITIIAAKEIQFFPYTRTNPAVNATGPAQMTPLTLFDVYYIASTWGLVTPELEAYYKKVCGTYWTRFKQLAMNRQADTATGIKLLKDPEFNLTSAGLHLACLIKLFGSSTTPANAARVVLGYNRGIAWSMRDLAKSMGMSESALIKQVAKPGWVWPTKFALTPTALASTAPSTEAKNYIADHLAPGGYFDQAKSLGLTTNTTM